MDILKELLEKVKMAESVEELLAIAKAEGAELSEEEAEKLFAELRETGAFSEQERLD